MSAPAQVHAKKAKGAPKPGTVVGRFTVMAGKPLDNSWVTLYFNERLWGTYRTRTDDSGYFSLRLPLGQNALALVEYFDRSSGKYFRNVPDSALQVTISTGDTVVYIGDIEMDWIMTTADKRSNGGAMGVVREARGEKGTRLVLRASMNSGTASRFENLLQVAIPNKEARIR